MLKRCLPVFTAVALSATVVGLSGCSSKPENSPVIRKKFAEVDGIRDEMAETNKTLKALAGDITVMKDEVSNLRALAPDGQGGSVLVSRLESIEKRLAELDGVKATIASANVQPTSNKTAGAEAAFNGLAVPQDKVVADAGTAKPTEKKETKATEKKTSTKPAEKKVSKPVEPKRSTPTGKWVTLQAGDTLDKIAGANGVSVSKLRESNHLPAGSSPLKGQRLFIPNTK